MLCILNTCEESCMRFVNCCVLVHFTRTNWHNSQIPECTCFICHNAQCSEWSIVHSSPKVMAIFVQYQFCYDNLVFLVNFVEIWLTLIACDASKLGIGEIWEIKFQTKQVHGSIQCRDLIKFEEWKVSIRLSLLGQPIDYEHDDDSCVLSGGLMLDGCHSTSGEPQSANPPHYGRWCWDCLIIVWWSTTRFRSDSNQNFFLANPKLPQLLGAAGPWYSQCAAWLEDLVKFRQAFMFALDLDQWKFAITGKVPQHHDGGVCLRRHVVVGHRQNVDA